MNRIFQSEQPAHLQHRPGSLFDIGIDQTTAFDPSTYDALDAV